MVDDDTCDYSSSNLFSSTLETIPFAWIFWSGQGRRGLSSSLYLRELSGHGANVEANEGESESGPDQNSQVAVRFYEAAQSGVRPCFQTARVISRSFEVVETLSDQQLRLRRKARTSVFPA
jgi:hypothetical protein